MGRQSHLNLSHFRTAPVLLIVPVPLIAAARLIVVGVLSVSVMHCRSSAGEPAPSDRQTAVSERSAGTVTGRVIYERDPQRSWRYSRYYVKDREQGYLAEAVVAITGLKRRKGDASEEPTTHVIDQENFQFVPETTAIQAGDRVKFLNSDGATHNVVTYHPLHSFNVNMPAGGEHLENVRQGRRHSQALQIRMCLS